MTSDLPRNARVGYEQLVNRRPSIVQSNRQRGQIRFITMYHLSINSINYIGIEIVFYLNVHTNPVSAPRIQTQG